MDGRVLLKDAAVFRSDGRVRRGMSVLLEGARVSKVAPDEEAVPLPGDWVISCRGRLVAPGLVNCHAHLVNAQLLPPTGERLLQPPAQLAALDRRLAEALTAPEIEALAAHAVARALRAGVTLVAEHLTAPKAVEGGLLALAKVAERLGIRLVASHSTSSLYGDDAALAELDQNEGFALGHQAHPLVRGAVGFHNSSTASDELLRRIGRLRDEKGIGAHFHLAETENDLTETYARTGKRIVTRLDGLGILGPGSVAAYARVLDRGDSERLSRSRTLTVLLPREALSAEGGQLKLEALLAHPNLVALGALDGSGLWHDAVIAFSSALQVARAGRLLDPDGLLAQLVLANPAELLGMLFGTPCGVVEEGALADLVVYDHTPPSPSDVAWETLFELAESRPAWTIVAGRVTVREGELVGHDFMELAHEAARARDAVYKRAGVVG